MTTNPHVKAGTAYGCDFTSSGCNAPQSECMNLCLHRVDSSQMEAPLVERLGGSAPLGIMKYDAVEFAAPEPIDFGSYRFLVAALLVLCIAGLAVWGFS